MSLGWLSSLGCSITRSEGNTPSLAGEGRGEEILVSLARRLDLMSVRGSTTAILSFAWPKESIQRKGHPDAAYLLRSEAFAGGRRKGLPASSSTRRIHATPLRADPAESSGARRGIREPPRPNRSLFFTKFSLVPTRRVGMQTIRASGNIRPSYQTRSIVQAERGVLRKALSYTKSWAMARCGVMV